MKFEDIKALNVPNLASDNAVLWLWCVNPLLAKGFELLAHWGFTYKGLLTWVKVTKSLPLRPAIGNGYWLRGATEHLMLGVRGTVKPKVKNQPTWFMAPLAEHSRKPVETYNIIERFSDGPYLELFARPQNPLFPIRVYNSHKKDSLSRGTRGADYRAGVEAAAKIVDSFEVIHEEVSSSDDLRNNHLVRRIAGSCRALLPAPVDENPDQNSEK